MNAAFHYAAGRQLMLSLLFRCCRCCRQRHTLIDDIAMAIDADGLPLLSRRCHAAIFAAAATLIYAIRFRRQRVSLHILLICH